jgi:putative phosphoribosyl transferase
MQAMNFVLRALFQDRTDAGHHLGARLSHYADRSVVTLGLARGGVLVAAEVAKQLHAPLDVLVVRKLGSPYSAELAIGAVTASGGLYLNEQVIQEYAVSQTYIDAEMRRQRKLAEEREVLYRQGQTPLSLKGKTAILVDDGMATGSTMIAAARSVRQEADFVCVAVPVGAPESCKELREEADEVICLYNPDPFYAVGLYYQDFSEVSDDMVREALGQKVAQ